MDLISALAVCSLFVKAMNNSEIAGKRSAGVVISIFRLMKVYQILYTY
tara:strand:- start:75 stop:218 length:144 start_codon:yes stop_codon:yes gene_type:complete